MACGVWGPASIRPASQTSQQVTQPWCWVTVPSLSPYRARELVSILRRDHQGVAQCAQGQGQAGWDPGTPLSGWRDWQVLGLSWPLCSPLLPPALSQEPHPLALPSACSPSPYAPFSALDLSRFPLPPLIFLYFILTLSAPPTSSPAFFLFPSTVSPPSHSPFHPFIPPPPLAPPAHLSLPQSFTCHPTSRAHTHTHTACSGLGGPCWLWWGSRGDVVGGEGLPTCLRALASKGTWGPRPGPLLELRVGSATRAGRHL